MGQGLEFRLQLLVLGLWLMRAHVLRPGDRCVGSACRWRPWPACAVHARVQLPEVGGEEGV